MSTSHNTPQRQQQYAAPYNNTQQQLTTHREQRSQHTTHNDIHNKTEHSKRSIRHQLHATAINCKHTTSNTTNDTKLHQILTNTTNKTQTIHTKQMNMTSKHQLTIMYCTTHHSNQQQTDHSFLNNNGTERNRKQQHTNNDDTNNHSHRQCSNRQQAKTQLRNTQWLC